MHERETRVAMPRRLRDAFVIAISLHPAFSFQNI
jgi:hypothetical protein